MRAKMSEQLASRGLERASNKNAELLALPSSLKEATERRVRTSSCPVPLLAVYPFSPTPSADHMTQHGGSARPRLETKRFCVSRACKVVSWCTGRGRLVALCMSVCLLLEDVEIIGKLVRRSECGRDLGLVLETKASLQH